MKRMILIGLLLILGAIALIANYELKIDSIGDIL
jgi:hypothetical protein